MRDRWDGLGALEFVQDLFARTASFLDARLSKDLLVHFPERLWEMCVVALLLEAGVELAPTAERPFRKQGPDILLAHEKTWVEAISVGAGSGPDRLVPIAPSGGRALQIPDESITLRLTNGIAEKSRQGRSYFENGLLGPDDPFIIAINAGEVPYARHEQEPPRIVKALYPLGNLEIILGSEGSVLGSRYQYRPQIRKKGGAGVSTSFFLSPDSAHVSAVLYGCVNEYNRPRSLRGAAILVHNLNARNPLPPRTIRVGREYVADGDRLTVIRHAETST